MNERRPPVVTSSWSGPMRRQVASPRDHPPSGKVRERDRGQEPPATELVHGDQGAGTR
jgi:hypothetical protein